RRFAVLAFLAGVWGLALSGTGRADDVVYNNFGAGNGGLDYNTGSYHTLGNAPNPAENWVAGEKFTPSQTGSLSQITIALLYLGGTNAGTVSLRADNAGLPGAVLESFSVTSLPSGDGHFHAPLTVTDTLNQPLVAGTPYWVVASTTTSSHLAWNLNNTGATSDAISSDGGTTWSNQPTGTAGGV